MQRTVILGTGSFLPPVIKTNRDFTIHDFFNEEKKRIEMDASIIVDKFKNITGIDERRYVSPEMNTSDIGTIAAKEAILESKIDIETLDQIIVAHNFGNVVKYTNQTDVLPALASRIKHNLGIKNPRCVAYDILFGCPGWIQGLIQVDTYFKAKEAKRCLVIGTETLSRVLDLYDRDSMIFSDGAGACVAEYQDVQENGAGILSHCALSHCMEEAYYLYLGESNFPGSDPRLRYIKMNGRKIYEYALKNVPMAMKECIEKAGLGITEISKIFIHQANEKLDEAIIKAFYKLFGIMQVPELVMPMNIHKLGNSSVATVPTLFDMVRKGQIPGYSMHPGEVVLFASVGAGMNINAIAYRI